MNLSRRWFLVGAGAAAVAAVVPAVVLPVAPAVAAPVAKIVPFPKYPGPFLQLHPAQWRHFEREGFNMDLCRLIEPIPTTPKVRRGKRR